MADAETPLMDSEALAKECGELESDIASLKVRYEQYFMGMDRMPPNTAHSDVRTRMNRLKAASVRNTALKFRIQSIASKFLTYERLWQRTLQEMENGTYRRDLFKAKLRGPKQAPEPEKPRSAPAAALVPAAAPPSPPLPPAPGGLSEAKVKAIFDAYVTAKRQCKEDVSRLSLDAVASSLRKQVPDLLKRHNAKEVEFKVVIKDGKAQLRAVPKV